MSTEAASDRCMVRPFKMAVPLLSVQSPLYHVTHLPAQTQSPSSNRYMCDPLSQEVTVLVLRAEPPTKRGYQRGASWPLGD